ncbi:MAG: hypothetical protein KGJ10_03990 [Acidobacteriota bacterium]|nr:hypothetical protein [Acidobacteriota bacterium]MDE3043968.1 hypothetical protein [Acidobacteriota bacterium]
MGTHDSRDRGVERRYRRDPSPPERLERGDDRDDDHPDVVNVVGRFSNAVARVVDGFDHHVPGRRFAVARE